VAKKKQTVARRLFEFAPVLGGRRLVTVTAGPGLEPILLSLDGVPDERLETGHGDFPKNQADAPNRFRIHYRGDHWGAVDIATREDHHFVQPLPDGRWLLVRPWDYGEQDRNAHVYESDGRLVESFHAGDGLADVQTTREGRVWISYFDEGIFGHTHLSGNGLVCLDTYGMPVFRFGDLADPVVETMADCYALNVCSGKEVWLYYYTDFRLVQLVEGRIAGHWRTPVAGSHAFAVRGGRVLLGGSYDRKQSVFLATIGAADCEELEPVDEGGRPLGSFRAFGRRGRLFLATGEALHAVDLPSV
jgi:hypothetical protein